MNSFIWNPAVHAVCGESLHFFFVKYKSKSIEFKTGVNKSLASAGIVHMSTFKLFGQWDLLIRFWSDSNIADFAKRKLKENIEIKTVDYYKAEDVIYYWAEDHNRNEINRKDIKKSDLTPDVIDILQEVGEKHSSYQEYLDKSYIFKSYESHEQLWRFYIKIRLIGNLEGNHDLQKYLSSVKNIKSLSLHSGFGTFANMLIKGEADTPEAINNFLEEITHIMSDREPITQTIIVAGTVGEISDLIDIPKARERWKMRCINRCFPRLKMDALPDSVSSQLQLKCQEFEEDGIIQLDKDNLIEKVFEARIEGSKNPLKKLFELPAKLEGKMRRKLPHMMHNVYGKNWYEKYNELIVTLGITKNKNIKSLSLREMSGLIAHIIIDKKIITIKMNDSEVQQTMNKWCELRNHLYHDGEKKAIGGWNSIYEYMRNFILIYYPLMDYMDRLED